MTVRKTILTLHLWVGLVSAPILAVLGVTGAILAFEDPLSDWLNARLVRVAPAGAPMPIEALGARLGGAYAGATLVAVSLPDDSAHAYQLTVRTSNRPSPVRVFVDPYTGRMLGTSADERTTLQTIHQLHLRLLAGERGKTVVGVMAIALAFLALSGLWLWWPGKIVRVRWSASGRRRTLDLHHTVGAVSFAFLLVFALTAIVIHWNDGAQRVFATLTRSSTGTPPPAGSDACTGIARRLPPDALLAAARGAEPGAHATSLQLPAADGALARVTMRFPEDRTPNGRTIVMVESCTGRVAYRQDTRTVALGYKIPRLWNRELHTGDLFGWPHRLLAAFFSLMLPVMALTGPLIWWQRRMATARRVALAPQPG